MIGKTFESVTKLPCRSWSEGREAIALGAAVYANHLWGSRTLSKIPEKDASDVIKHQAIAQYRGLLEAAWMDGGITPEERIYIGRRRKNLGLTMEESASIQREVIGKTMAELFPEAGWEDIPKSPGPSGEEGHSRPGVSLSLVPSPLILQVIAGVPTHELQGENLILRTHFVTYYLLKLETALNQDISRARLELKSRDGRSHAIDLPGLMRSHTLELYTADLEGWCIELGDRIELVADGERHESLVVSDVLCRTIDGMKSFEGEVPLTIHMKKSTFTSKFVMVLYNITGKKIKIEKFESTAGSLNSGIWIEVGQSVEIGWVEITRNFTPGDQFYIECKGYKGIAGLVAEDLIMSNSGVWGALAAAGGIALAALGG
jgi:hypothetical protein